ncbi:sodium-coupled monocarboxylate transporter 1-like isoform X1 [Portunus trituberculatus]|uniref:sodium-coupled monocarboxylate transporter 1-like isoform X1 n=1 Tax=Portunus trituberculatus TaxID=210409 RepID=UPI001E1CFB62|nr:sodium-coupled monocarboxylate transporter 1-like isoform X1 [Portunus trituberculatus]
MSSTEETIVAAGELVSARFSVVDYVVFSIMLVVSLGIGVYSAIQSRGRESTQDFLLGGRNMPPFPVAISLLGGIFSAISILGNPTEVFYFGAQVMMTIFGVIPASILVHQGILPIFYNLGILSLNEYVEVRFNSILLRKLSTMCHLLTKFFYMGICLYAPSLALSTVTGLSLWGSMISMGTVCTIYITIGGVKAVVYTDVLQTMLMFVGVLVVVVMCCVDVGVVNIWTTAKEGGRLEVFNLDTSPFTRHTLLSTIILGFYVTLNILGLNQGCYQRLASVSTLHIAQRLVIFFMLGMTGMWLLFYSSGVVAYAMYRDCDPLTSGRIEKPDQILPYLVMDKLGHFTGLPGLFVAAVYGGVLSSLSTAGNAIACLMWEDLLQPLPFFAKMSDTASTAICKLLSAVAGLSGIFLGMLAGKLGNVFHVTSSVSGSILGPMQGIFITGIYVPWVNSKGMLVGFLTAFCYNVTIVIGKFLRGGGSPKSCRSPRRDAPRIPSISPTPALLPS